MAEIEPETSDKMTDSQEANRVKTFSTTVLRIGIAGAGLMGKWHARAAEKAGGKVVGCVDADKNQAIRLAKNYSAAQSFDNLPAMLDEKSLDVLHVCTPTDSHAEIAALAVKAGVHLFIEKPLAQSAEETVSLYELAAKAGVRLCPAHQFVFQHAVEKAKNLMPRIGTIIHLQATVCSAGGAGLDDGHSDAIAADILPHPLSLFQTFLKAPLPEKDWKVFRPQSGELRVGGRAQEISLSIFVSMNSRPTINSFQIFGTRGTIHLNLFHGFAFMEAGKVSKPRKISQPFVSAVKVFSAGAFNLLRRSARFETAYPGLPQLVDKFYQSIREDAEPPITPERAINTARVRDFLIYSAGIDESTKF